MPNISITIYVTAKDYIKYVPHSEEINKAARELVKEKIKQIQVPASAFDKKQGDGDEQNKP